MSTVISIWEVQLSAIGTDSLLIECGSIPSLGLKLEQMSCETCDEGIPLGCPKLLLCCCAMALSYSPHLNFLR